MSKQVFEFEGLKCLCAPNLGSQKIAYILYPMDILAPWVQPAAERFGTSIVVVTDMNWQNELTPWPAEGVPRGTPNFKGEAPEFLSKLESLTSAVEANLAIGPVSERSLVGVSLSGLFTLWAWPQTNYFLNIASMSGSFWYDGFMAWFEKQKLSGKSGFAYFLLGREEPHSRVKAFDSVGENTERIVALLMAQGVNTRFDWVPGNHYQDPIPRLDRAMEALYLSEKS